MKQLIPPNALAEMLDTRLFDSKYFFIDVWSFVHLGMGMLLGLIIEKWWIILSLLIIYEIAEVLLIGIIFKPEAFSNRILDLVVGMAGFFLTRILVG